MRDGRREKERDREKERERKRERRKTERILSVYWFAPQMSTIARGCARS